MKERRNSSSHASTLPIALSTGLISISVILLAIAAPITTKKAAEHHVSGFQPAKGAAADSITALGQLSRHIDVPQRRYYGYA